jgi:aminocarboxymuconate-semialdehyde decarboxylase
MHHIGGWDVHTHIVPPELVAAAEAGWFGMRATPDTVQICGHGVRLHPLSEVDKLVERVRSDGLDGAVVSVPPPLFRPDLPDSDRRDYAGLINDGLRNACREHPRELRPLAYLPAEAPALAARIADALDDDWAGVIMGTELGPLSYASTAFDLLWETLSRRRLALFIHPGSTPDTRLDPFYLTNLLGNPVETTIAAANLIFAGVMHRFPQLNVILAHGGGCVAALCGRWQRGVETKRPGISPLREPPIEAVRRFYVDSLVHSPAFLTAIAEIVGTERILLGSDWPFPMGAPSAEHDLRHLDHDLKHRIRNINAETAFGARLKSTATV